MHEEPPCPGNGLTGETFLPVKSLLEARGRRQRCRGWAEGKKNQCGAKSGSIWKWKPPNVLSEGAEVSEAPEPLAGAAWWRMTRGAVSPAGADGSTVSTVDTTTYQDLVSTHKLHGDVRFRLPADLCTRS